MNVKYKAKAIRQLKAIEIYIAERNPTAAARVMKRLDDAICSLAVYPYAHREGALPGTRELVFGDIPYVVVYRVRARLIDILGVFHTSRDPSARLRP